MQLEKFFRRVLPDKGVYITGLLHGDKYHQTSTSKLEDLEDIIKKVINNNLDVYYATSTFKSSKREAVNVKEKKTFYIDIDCGEGKGYAAKAEGCKALYAFCAAINLPKPNLLVDSGGGVHAYWVLDKVVSLPAWQVVATALKTACLRNNFKADPACTADAARILRVPGSNNYRHGTHIPCRIIHESPKDYTLMEIAWPLKGIIAETKTLVAVTPSTKVDINTDLSAGIDANKVYYAVPMIKACPVLSGITKTSGANCNEPLWMHTLNILAFAEDGEKFIHVVGNQHKGYTQQSTLNKFTLRQQAKAKGATGPTLCTTFEQYLPDVCSACKYYKKIKTPLVLGIPEVKLHLPAGYMQNEHGVYRKVEGELRKIFPYQIFEFEAFFDYDSNGVVLSFTYHMAKAIGYAEVPLKVLADARGLAATLSIYAIALQRKQQAEFTQLMTTWYQDMQKAKQVKQLTSHMGWTKCGKLTGFVTGSTILWDNGTEGHSVMLDKKLKAQYTPKGTYEVWRTAAQYVLNQNNPESAAAIATAFAAPLIKFTGVSGILFSIISSKSGTGKTTALKIAQAVWGCPVRGINALDDTTLSVAHKMGYLNNLPAYWDELRMQEDVKQFIRLMFQISQGKEKSRLTSTINQQDMGTWKTLITVASNESLLDHVDQTVKNTDAGRLRVFEIEMLNYISSRRLAEANRIFLPIDNNYGHAGIMYAKWIVTNHKLVEETVVKNIELLTNKLTVASDERFWVCVIAALISGAAFASKAGIIKFDVPALVSYLMKEFIKLRGVVKDEYESTDATAIGHLFTYMGQRQSHTAVIEHKAVKNIPQGAVLLIPERTPVYIVISKGDNSVRVNYKDFKDWLYKNSQSPSWILTELERIGAEVKRGVLCQGLPGTIDSRIKLIDIPLNQTALSKMIGDKYE